MGGLWFSGWFFLDQFYWVLHELGVIVEAFWCVFEKLSVDMSCLSTDRQTGRLSACLTAPKQKEACTFMLVPPTAATGTSIRPSRCETLWSYLIHQGDGGWHDLSMPLTCFHFARGLLPASGAPLYSVTAPSPERRLPMQKHCIKTNKAGAT